MNAVETYRFAQENPEAMRDAQAQMQAMLARSATDFDFRQTLLSNPRAAIAEFSGKDVSDVPETVNLVFVENEADATIVLPDFIDMKAELSIEELETVAGGTDLLFWGGVAAGMTAVGAVATIAGTLMASSE